MDGRDTPTSGSWRRYCGVVVLTIALQLLIVCAFILVSNPFGNLPATVFARHVIMDSNQRFQYPAIARSGLYDSLVIGTSTARLLRPAALERVLAGRFANLAMDSARPWEQYRIAGLFADHAPTRRTLLVGVDIVWCVHNADADKITNRGWPEWMYDDNLWNDLPPLFNMRSVEIGGRRIANALGLNPESIGFDGYGVFVPDESQYDLAKARELIGKRPVSTPDNYVATPRERGAWRYPALAWLDELIDVGWEQVVVMIMPVHVAAQPRPGSKSAAIQEECKARLAALGKRRGVPVVDFRIWSPITTRDENYWDKLHYRVPIAERIVADLGRALASGEDDPEGHWRVLAPPPRPDAAPALRSAYSH